jgi:DNA (cytosine-5)-methyltransferase 1
LFGGIGGFRLGLEQASDRYECVDYIEYDDYAVNSYNEIFEEEHEPKDVTELDTNQIPEHDLICAGFPCQAFSVAGNREGTDDSRGKLFREIVRIAQAHRPEMLLLENVKGLLSQKAVQDGESVEGTKGHAFREILSSLHELGYCLEWRVLNSKNWGVPQNRERVFIVGHLGGEPREKVFPLPRENREDTGEDGKGLGAVSYGTHNQDRLFSRNGLSSTLRGNGNAGHHIKVLGNVNPSGRGMNEQVYEAYSETISPTVTTNKGEGHKIIDETYGFDDVRQYDELVPNLRSERTGLKIINHQMRPESRPSIQNGQSGGSGILFNSDYSYALSSSPHFAKCSDRRIRKLTPRECWRLQGFPDWAFNAAQKENSDTQLYKQAGNAVTVNVIEALGRKIEEVYD